MRADAVADSDDGVEAVVVDLSGDLPLALGAIAICVFAIAADRSSIHGAMEFILPALVLVTLALSLRDTRG